MIIINNIKINQCFIIHSLYKSNNKTKKIYDYIGFINSLKLLNNKIIIYCDNNHKIKINKKVINNYLKAFKNDDNFSIDNYYVKNINYLISNNPYLVFLYSLYNALVSLFSINVNINLGNLINDTLETLVENNSLVSIS